jgi:hypothetical protein
MPPVPEHGSPSGCPVLRSVRTEQLRDITPPKRVEESKRFVPQLSDLDDTDAASTHSDVSVKAENSQEREDDLVMAGNELTGDALKAFLQTNFVDYIDDKIFDIPSLDLLDT